MKYDALSIKDGIEYSPKVWNIFISTQDNFFAEPFSYREMRWQCLFKKEGGPPIIYLALTTEDIEKYRKAKLLSETTISQEIYLYGAYNQMDVCQIRIHCKTKEVEERVKMPIMSSMARRVLGHKIGDDIDQKLDVKERKPLVSILQSTKTSLFMLSPISYGYGHYKRG